GVAMSDVWTAASATQAALRVLVTPASPDALAFRESPTAWTVHEVLCHVTDGEVTDWRPRVAIVMDEKGDKRFTPFDRVGGQKAYGAWAVPALVEEFGRLRRDNVSYLPCLSLTNPSLPPPCLHPKL